MQPADLPETPGLVPLSGHPVMPVSASASNTASRLRSDDSWIEVSSRPSSSSLSSAGEEIITTGLRLTQSEEQRRRRRLRRSVTDWERTASRLQSGAVSSQEEYEESESESDRVMNSSNEGIHPLPPRDEWRLRHPMSSASSDNAYASDEEDDADENATAVGSAPPDNLFTPQPNAFTYIPSSRPSTAVPAQELEMPDASSYFTQQRPTPRPSHHRHSFPASQAPQHSPYNIISPSHRIDHDAALRASLNTLLSCAAAVRGVPKSSTSEATARRVQSNRIDTTTLRMVPESVAMGTKTKQSTTNATATTSAARSPATTTSDSASDKGKRKANMTSPSSNATAPAATTATPRSSSKDRRASKKPRRASSTPTTSTPAFMDELTPTLLTWALSAGVVVLVSALSFSAGYVVGKDVGKAEAEAAQGFVEAIGSGGMNCGGDFVREGGLGLGSGGTGLGLRRLRWTGGASVVQV